jgi:hypothetical protein
LKCRNPSQSLMLIKPNKWKSNCEKTKLLTRSQSTEKEEWSQYKKIRLGRVMLTWWAFQYLVPILGKKYLNFHVSSSLNTCVSVWNIFLLSVCIYFLINVFNLVVMGLCNLPWRESWVGISFSLPVTFSRSPLNSPFCLFWYLFFFEAWYNLLYWIFFSFFFILFLISINSLCPFLFCFIFYYLLCVLLLRYF